MDAASSCAPTSTTSIECFGLDRILYGGDWPVSELAGRYPHGSRRSTGRPRLRRAEKRKLFRDNAIKAYRLNV